MTANHKGNQIGSVFSKALAVGTVSAIVLTLVGAAIFGALISKEMIGEAAIAYAAMGIVCVSSIAGAAIASANRKEKRLYVCLIAGIIYYAILLAMTALFFDGQYQGMGITALLILGGCTAVALLGSKNVNRKKIVRHKNRHR